MKPSISRHSGNAQIGINILFLTTETICFNCPPFGVLRSAARPRNFSQGNEMRKLLLTTLLVTAAVPALAFDRDEGPLTVSVAYTDTLRAGGKTPGIWSGGTNVQFVGTAGPYDAGALKLHNQNPFAVTVLKVTVDIGHVHGINVWADSLPISIPPGGQLILTQTAFYNFDTSDMPKGKVSCKPNDIKAIVRITEQTPSTKPTTYTFLDASQVLNTGGIDTFICGANESTGVWSKIEPLHDGSCKDHE